MQYNKFNSEMIKKVALEYGRNKGSADLSKELGVSRQCIDQLVNRLRKTGVIIPRIRSSAMRTALNELKQEHPEIFKESK
jgi:biotin operon repressor